MKQINEINEVLNTGATTGNKNGHLFINFYKLKANIGILMMINLRDGSSVMSEYEHSGDTSGIDLLK